MYKILGADQREYGPVSAEVLLQWVREGRANASTLVQAEGASEWKPLSNFAEFADALHAGPNPPPITPVQPPSQQASPVLDQEYELDVGECFGRSWRLLKANLGLFLGGTAIFLLIELGILGLSAMPVFNLMLPMVSFIVAGPLIAGAFHIIFQRIRGQPAEIADLFCGFDHRFGQFVLAYVAPVLLSLLVIVPGPVLLIIGSVLLRQESSAAGIVFILFGTVLSLIPALYFGISWSLTTPLVLDKKLDFWHAMQVSRKMTAKRFISFFSFFIMILIINVCGLLACGIGLLVTLPFGLGALAFAYETMFTTQNAPKP